MPQIKANSWELVLRKYQPEEELVDLISRMLTYDAKNRLRPLDALKHAYFRDLAECKEYCQRLPLLFYFKDLENEKNGKDIA